MVIQFIKQYKNIILAALAAILIIVTYFFGYHNGYNSGYIKGKSEVKETVKEVKIPGKATTETKTVIQYVPKSVDTQTRETEKTDIEVAIPKTDLHLKVNGQEQVIHKDDSEKQVLEKNKVTLDQKSTATFEVKVPTVDNTRKWAAGVGYGNHGLAGKIDFPLKHPVGGWIYGDKKTIAGGIQVSF